MGPYTLLRTFHTFILLMAARVCSVNKFETDETTAIRCDIGREHLQKHPLISPLNSLMYFVKL